MISNSFNPQSILKPSSHVFSKNTLDQHIAAQRSKIFFDIGENTLDSCSNRKDLRKTNQWEDPDIESIQSLIVLNDALQYLITNLLKTGHLLSYEFEEIEIPLECRDSLTYMDSEFRRIKEDIRELTKLPMDTIDSILIRHKEIKDLKTESTQLKKAIKINQANQKLKKIRNAEIQTSSNPSSSSQSKKRKTLEPDSLSLTEMQKKEVKYPTSDIDVADILISLSSTKT